MQWGKMNWKLGSHEKKQSQNNSQLVKKFQYKDWGYGIIDVCHTDVPFDYFSDLGIFDKNTISAMTGGVSLVIAIRQLWEFQHLS